MTNIDQRAIELQGEVMALRLAVERLAGGVAEETTESRAACTLYVRARRVARSFIHRARGHQVRAMHRSRKLVEFRAAWLDLYKRFEYLAWLAQENPCKTIPGIKADLLSIKSTIDEWGSEVGNRGVDDDC
jgi:hypothetical protein